MRCNVVSMNHESSVRDGDTAEPLSLQPKWVILKCHQIRIYILPKNTKTMK